MRPCFLPNTCLSVCLTPKARLVGGQAYRSFVMPPCDGHGHYHPFQKQCVCGYGWVGKFCETDAIPACRNDSGIAQTCTTRREPLPCACIRQCVTAGSFAPHMREPLHAPVCSSRGEYVSWKLDDSGEVQLASVAAEHPLRGASKRDWVRWDEQFEAWTCFNGCSGRGACLHGACVCSVGFYGPGCAHPVGGAVEAAVPSSQLSLSLSLTLDLTLTLTLTLARCHPRSCSSTCTTCPHCSLGGAVSSPIGTRSASSPRRSAPSSRRCCAMRQRSRRTRARRTSLWCPRLRPTWRH